LETIRTLSDFTGEEIVGPASDLNGLLAIGDGLHSWRVK
jgi:hypothetical protein